MPYGKDDDGGAWMTKRELASIRRISVASADRLARRMKWRKQPGNDGRGSKDEHVEVTITSKQAGTALTFPFAPQLDFGHFCLEGAAVR